jgi:hypothetical protein
MDGRFDKTCIDLMPIEAEPCSDCDRPATHFLSIDLGFQTSSLGDLAYCEECGKEMLERWREQLPDPPTADVTVALTGVAAECAVGSVLSTRNHNTDTWNNKVPCVSCGNPVDYSGHSHETASETEFHPFIPAPDPEQSK